MSENELLEKVRELRECILKTWQTVAKPEGKLADTGCLEDADVEALFHGRDWKSINLNAVPYSEEMPMIYMTHASTTYYIQSYFSYCLCDSTLHEIRWRTPFVHLIDTLVAKHVRKHSVFSIDQISCIIEFLNLIKNNPETFGKEDMSGRLSKAIAGWETELKKLKPKGGSGK